MLIRHLPWLLLAMTCMVSSAPGQPLLERRTQLSASVQLNEIDATTQTTLKRIDALLADQQWDEAIDKLRAVMAKHGDALVGLQQAGATEVLSPDESGRVFVPLRLWGQQRLASLHKDAPDALALYRRQLDDVARQWFEEGAAKRDERLLNLVVDDAFCTRSGDDALAMLGELALQRGDFTAARNYWQRIDARLMFAPPKVDDAAPHRGVLSWWSAHRKFPELSIADLAAAAPPTVRRFAAFPDTDWDLADLRARLVLVSILEGAAERAAWELQVLRELHPDARGKLAGRDVDYAEALSSMLTASQQWAAPPQASAWQTFGGDAARQHVASQPIDPAGEAAWSIVLGLRGATDDDNLIRSGFALRVAEAPDALLSTFPVVTSDGTVLFCDQIVPDDADFSLPKLIHRLRAFDLKTGQARWPRRREVSPTDAGVIYRTRPFTAWRNDRQRIGVPRFTLTVHEQFAFARLGRPQTTVPSDEVADGSIGQLVAVDLSQQGKLLWQPIEPEPSYAFEGAPVCDGQFVYIAERRNQTPPQAHLACYDLKTGKRRWRKFIAAAETAALGRREEITHNLLTLDQGVLYFNTNLGAVAAVRASDGATLWVNAYPRDTQDVLSAGDPPAHFQRDLNPCVLWRGLLFVAPTDSHLVLCLDAATGQTVWTASPSDVVHLLGVGSGNLLASGRRLWWLDAETGETKGRFPMGPKAEPAGWGRGVLAGSHVYWPTREQIYVFDQQTTKPVRQPINLARRGLRGGNLLVAGEYLLVATPESVYAFHDPTD